MDHFSLLSRCIYIPSADVINWPHAPGTIPTSPLSLGKLPLPTILPPYPPTHRRAHLIVSLERLNVQYGERDNVIIKRCERKHRQAMTAAINTNVSPI